MIVLTPGEAGLDTLEAIYRGSEPFRLDRAARPAVEAAAARITEAASGETPVYGVNTGFGKLASVRVPSSSTAALQRNLIRSHAAGVGRPLAAPVVRLVIALKLLSLGRGASGVRWELIEALEALVAHEIQPIIPSQGSVGASGDLAPLAHLTAAVIGEGTVLHRGHEVPAEDALQSEGLHHILLGPKEGLAMINGTQVSTALALAGLFEGWSHATASLATGALSTDAAMGSPAPFRPEIHALRGHAGQIEAASALRGLLAGSEIRESHRDGDERVQDPYCIRCQPQVIGACLDLLRQAGRVLRIEANAVTDNPLVLSDGDILSGGNFHAEPVAFAADQIALALAEVGAIAQRRVALLVDPTLSFGLPAFLAPEPGLNSGFMIAEVTSAALMSENKALANPRSVDSTPTSADQEDHVSMACHGARRLTEMAENLAHIIGIELLVAAQGVELRRPLTTSAPLRDLIGRLRLDIPALEHDRHMAPDIAAATALVRTGAVHTAAGHGLFPDLAAG
ncbi:histidine ammonia-lyase [Paralimibaculum aggregatum]|uniref:Histidine ammonia-lyase n=1 Tax=Paralimibaculum aggregatum TaxID=3036245 RepID=A0ABQ6LTA3_9RHOB|nr:histidine ammonia-lyase [Limibaculum sp. NKW23]GMG85328.1 histidine ammonia-lyase [Limibaculum sp. NKW23]